MSIIKSQPQTELSQTMNTLNHIKPLENKEYLAMKDAMAEGASCKSCTDFKQHQFSATCMMHSKTIRHYNICTRYKKIAS
jgi:hypothetical protein